MVRKGSRDSQKGPLNGEEGVPRSAVALKRGHEDRADVPVIPVIAPRPPPGRQVACFRGLKGIRAAGIGCGLIVALFAPRVLATMVYDVSPTDPATLAAVALLLIAVGAAACLLPALRATRVDPVIVLREE